MLKTGYQVKGHLTFKYIDGVLSVSNDQYSNGQHLEIKYTCDITTKRQPEIGTEASAGRD